MTTLSPQVERSDGGVATAEWSVWTTTARVVVTRQTALGPAQEIVREILAAVDQAASRFRADSEVRRLADVRSAGSRVTAAVSPLLADLVEVALDAAQQTGGAVDPTIGNDLVRLGYATGVPSSASGSGGGSIAVRSRPSWRDVVLDRSGDRPTLTVPTGTLIDLGSTAKAWAADLSAVQIAQRLGGGVLVSLGGDLRVAGDEAPQRGWQVLVQDGPNEPAGQVALDGAHAIATSSTLHRRWQADGRSMHHILDPSTGHSAPPVWRTASVAADTCVAANTLATAALVLGHRIVPLLRDTNVCARLVAADRQVITLGAWPR
jgi:thiamine biosynthesis lipoprotein